MDQETFLASFPPQDVRRWQRELAALGREVVRARLEQMRSILAKDPMPGLVGEEPYPPRRFVEWWVVNEDNRLIPRGLVPTIMIGMVLVLFCGYFAFRALISLPWTSPNPTSASQVLQAASPTASPGTSGSGQPSSAGSGSSSP